MHAANAFTGKRGERTLLLLSTRQSNISNPSGQQTQLE